MTDYNSIRKRIDYNTTDEMIGERPGAEEQLQNARQEKDIPVEKLSDSAFYRMYLNEVRDRKIAAHAEQIELYRKFLDGDQTVSEKIVDNWLMRIIEMTKFYKDTPVNMEDVIQEGNMGLWLALSRIPAEMQAEDVEAYLLEHVKEAMENYIREITGDADQVQAIVGKAALLYEAQELLAKENGEVPSMRQLSEYTHIPAEEIQDILALFKDEEG